MPRRRPPARSMEARENDAISLAYDLAEEQMRNGTATSQVITHFLKLGTERERLEREILAEQAKLVSAKTNAIEAEANMEETYQRAIEAMKRYSGNGRMPDENV